jgi:hypothetical protein
MEVDMTSEELEKLKELEKRVMILEDIEEIKKLHRRYVFSLCNRQWDDLLDCFAEDGIAKISQHGIRKGKKEVKELVYNCFDKLAKTPLHLLCQPVISVEGDRAKGHWLLCLISYGPKMKWGEGRYDNEYVKVDGKWKFSLVDFHRWKVD